MSSHRGITITTGVPSAEGTAVFTVAQDGIYQVCGTLQMGAISGTALVQFSAYTSDGTNPQTLLGGHSSSIGLSFSISGLMRVYSGQTISLLVDSTIVPSLNNNAITFSASRVGEIGI
jgi:hypothetical protein